MLLMTQRQLPSYLLLVVYYMLASDGKDEQEVTLVLCHMQSQPASCSRAVAQTQQAALLRCPLPASPRRYNRCGSSGRWR